MSEKDPKQAQIELVTNVLNITRDQLSRSMNLNAELEALLAAERATNEELKSALEAATADQNPDAKK